MGGLDLLQGAGAGLLMLLAGALLLHLVRHATGIGFGWIAGRGLLARFAEYEFAMAFVAVAVIFQVAAGVAHGKGLVVPALAALVAGFAATLFGGFDLLAVELGVGTAVLSVVLFRRPASLPGSWIGLMLLALAAAVTLQVVAPTIAMVIAWPLAAAAVCAPAAPVRDPPDLLDVHVHQLTGPVTLIAHGCGLRRADHLAGQRVKVAQAWDVVAAQDPRHRPRWQAELA